MSETFYRVHDTSTCGEFSADNAWSSTMGMDRNPEDISQVECMCVVTDGEPSKYCDDCEGTGWVDADRGYSCCDSATALLEYFRSQPGEPAACTPVVIFEGRRSGNDPDGEALAVPERVIRWTTWAGLAAECEAAS